MRQAREKDNPKDEPMRLRKGDLPEAISQAVLRLVEGGFFDPYDDHGIKIGIRLDQSTSNPF